MMKLRSPLFIVQSGNIVRTATSDDADPTPGYTFVEMASLFLPRYPFFSLSFHGAQTSTTHSNTPQS